MVRDIESEYLSHFTRFNVFDLFCSRREGTQMEEGIVFNFSNIVAGVRYFKLLASILSSFFSASHGYKCLPPYFSVVYTKLAPCSSDVTLL